MFAHGIIILLILIGGFYAVWKFFLLPIIEKHEEEVPEHVKILNEKLEKAQLLREELEAVKKEKDVTSEIIDADAEIEALIKEIAFMERKDD